VNGAAERANSTGALELWLAAEQPSTPGKDGQELVPPELAAMRDELALLAAKAELQRHPAWLDVLSDDEVDAERAAAQRIRGLRRDQQLAAATAAVALTGREQRAEQVLANLDLTERVWQRRALVRRRRLLDPTARLAAAYRAQLASTIVLFAVAVAGIGWTSMGVHDALVGPEGPVLAYLVEPLFCLPLLVIMAAHGTAARWGRRFPAPEHRGKVYALEAGLLLLTVLVNSASVLPGLGTWRDTTTLLAHLAPPVLILVAVVLQPWVSSFFAEILATAHVDAPDPGGRRLTVETVNVLTMVAAVRGAVRVGSMPLWEDTGLPSVSEIARHFACEKRKAQGVHDALRMLADGAAPRAEDRR